MSNPTQEALCAQFSPGDRVRYVPYHAHGDTAHEDCVNGEVTSVSTFNVRVLFDGKTHSQACNPDQLTIQHGATTVAERFEAWALVEIMGHQRVAGRVTEEVIAGANLLRVDIPQAIPGEAEFRTEYLGPSSIYRMSITTEAAARQLAGAGEKLPAYAFGLRAQAPALPSSVPATGGVDDEEIDTDDRW